MKEECLLMVEMGAELELMAQRIREATCLARGEALSPRLWLRSMKELQGTVEGSLMVIREAAGQPTWFVPMARQGSAAVRRIRGEPWIRVSRDGADHGTSYTKLTTMVEAVWSQGITRRSVDGSRGTDVEDDGSVIEPRTELLEMMDNAGLQAGLVWWERFTSDEGWEPPALQVMVGMTETHPHSIGRGEFHVASQPEGEMSKSFAASYFRGFTDSGAHTTVRPIGWSSQTGSVPRCLREDGTAHHPKELDVGASVDRAAAATSCAGRGKRPGGDDVVAAVNGTRRSPKISAKRQGRGRT
ncbi:MAG: hypothetical protein SGPRY_006968 [Prymnesium sp.]